MALFIVWQENKVVNFKLTKISENDYACIIAILLAKIEFYNAYNIFFYYYTAINEKCKVIRDKYLHYL